MFERFRSAWDGFTGKNHTEITPEMRSFIAGAFGQTTPRRGTRELLQAYRELPWLRGVVHRIAETGAGVRFKLSVVRPGGKGKAINPGALKSAGFAEREILMRNHELRGDLVEIHEHPFLGIMEQANPLIDGLMLRMLQFQHYDLVGEFFARKLRVNGVTTELWPLPPHWVTGLPTADRPSYETTIAGQVEYIPAEDMVYIRDPDPERPYGRGTGTAAAMGDELDTDEYAARYIKSFFANNGVPALLVGFEAVNGIGPDPSEVDRVKSKWLGRHQGIGKGHGIEFLSWNPKVHQLSYTFKDQQVIKLREFLRDTVRQLYGVPPEIMGQIENSNRATIQAASFILAQWVLVPRLERFRSAYQQIVNETDDRIIVSYVSPVPEDREHKLNVMKAAPYHFPRSVWQQEAGFHDLAGQDVFVLQPGSVAVDVDEEITGVPLAPIPVPSAPEPKRITAGKSPVVQVVSKDFGLDAIPNTLAAMQPEQLELAAAQSWSPELQAWGSASLAALGTDVTFTMNNPAVVRHLEVFATDRMPGVNATLRESLRGELVAGVRAGEDVADLSARVRGVYTAQSQAGAARIARSEVLRSANFGTFQSHRVSGLVDERQWISTIDARVRDTHLAINGTIRGIDQAFEIDGHAGMYPHAFNVPEIDINCRCTTVAIIAGAQRDLLPWVCRAPLTGEAIKNAADVFDKETDPWRLRFLALLQVEFKAQEDRILAEMRRQDT